MKYHYSFIYLIKIEFYERLKLSFNYIELQTANSPTCDASTLVTIPNANKIFVSNDERVAVYECEDDYAWLSENNFQLTFCEEGSGSWPTVGGSGQWTSIHDLCEKGIIKS